MRGEFCHILCWIVSRWSTSWKMSKASWLGLSMTVMASRSVKFLFAMEALSRYLTCRGSGRCSLGVQEGEESGFIFVLKESHHGRECGSRSRPVPAGWLRRVQHSLRRYRAASFATFVFLRETFWAGLYAERMDHQVRRRRRGTRESSYKLGLGARPPEFQ